MDKKTLEALHGSIRKWEAIVAGTGIDDGHRNCPLCQMFLLELDGFTSKNPMCRGCPVYERTGETGCKRTPYDQYHDVENEENARAELAFLRSLLPLSHGIINDQQFSVTDQWGLRFVSDNVLVYVSYVKDQGNRLANLMRAREYIDQEIRKNEQG